MPLERSVSLYQAVIYGIGVILGAGIYALIGVAAGISGNALWISFIIAALIAGLTALSYAELGARFPREAAEAFFVRKAFGSRPFAFFVGFIAFFTLTVSATAVAWGFASYFKLFTNLSPLIVAIGIVLICSAVNFRGIQESVRLNNIFTLIEAFGLLLIIAFGIPFLGSVDLFTGISGETGLALVPALFSSAALIFFAFLGFEEIPNIAEEIRNPRKNVPLAIILSLSIATILYILVAMMSVSVVSPMELANAANTSASLTEGPLALVAEKSIGPGFGFWLTIIALFATFNTVLVLLITASRFLYGLSKQDMLPLFLSKIHPKTKTPYFAIMVVLVLGVLLAAAGNLEVLGNMTTMGTFLMFFAVNAALIKVRLSEKTGGTPFSGLKRIPWLAVLGAAFCAYMFSTQFWFPATIMGVTLPLIVFGLGIFALSIPIYWFFSIRR